MKHSEKGFAMVLLMTLIPILLAFAGGSFFLFSFLKQDLGTLNICRAEQLAVQNKAGAFLKKLLDLNPKALRLRAEERAAQLRLEAAMMSGNPPAINSAEGKLASVQAERVQLSGRQQEFINSANSLLIAGGSQVTSDLHQEWTWHQRPMSFWLHSELTTNTPTVPQLAVVPDAPDVAPVYSPDPQFDEKQTWTQSWKVSQEAVGPFKSFLKFHHHFERSCSTSLYRKGEKWIAKLNSPTAADKYLSRAFY